MGFKCIIYILNKNSNSNDLCVSIYTKLHRWKSNLNKTTLHNNYIETRLIEKQKLNTLECWTCISWWMEKHVWIDEGIIWTNGIVTRWVETTGMNFISTIWIDGI